MEKLWLWGYQELLLSGRPADARADPRPIADAVESSHAGADDTAPDADADAEAYSEADASASA